MEPAQRDPKWKAGEAQPARGLARLADFGAPGLLAYMALDLSRKFAFGGALAALSLAAYVQIPTTLRQIDEQAQSLLAINAMKAEQRWLVGQGLATERPIGRLAQADPDSSNGASMGERATLGGWLVHPQIASYANAISEAALGRSPVPVATTINAPFDRDSTALDGRGIQGDLGFVYRHEEGHARERAQGLPASAPSAWPPMVGKALAQELSGPGMVGENWRLALMRSWRAEGFADAFAVLSTARKAPGAMADAALATQALRSMPSESEPLVATSLRSMAGDHSVDMASFIAGQLGQERVAKLGSAGIDQLAEGVASASLAATLARQAPLINFFSPEGKRWWMDLSAKHGADPAEAASAWTQWRSGALAERPDAAFGAVSLKAEGMEFQAKGLPAPPKGVSWRFDGHGEPSDKDGAASSPRALWASNAEEGLSRLAQRLSDTGAGAAWTHRAMAARVGADDGAERARLARQVGPRDKNDLDAIDKAWRAPKPKR